MRFQKLYVAGAICGLLLCSACRDNSFKVDGVVEGADGESVVIEKPDFNGLWTVVDSTRLSSSGKFSFEVPKGAGPEVYRIAMENRYVYFPVDSTENIHIETTLSNFGHLYTLSGSRNAESLSRFESEFARFAAKEENPDSAAAFKRHLFTQYLLPGKASVVSYYILTKTMADGRPLYDMTSAEDRKYLAAVATAYTQIRPDDPHAKMLESWALGALRQQSHEQGKSRQLMAEELQFPSITLTDEKGEERSLAELAGKGTRVLLVFSPLTDPEAPARNRELMEKWKNGWKIFHVAYDTDQYAWREAAANLPWTTVIDPSATPQSAIDYNISSLPVYFLIDAEGNLYDRKDSPKGF